MSPLPMWLWQMTICIILHCTSCESNMLPENIGQQVGGEMWAIADRQAGRSYDSQKEPIQAYCILEG